MAAVFLSGSEEANCFASVRDLKTAAMPKASEVRSRKISVKKFICDQIPPLPLILQNRLLGGFVLSINIETPYTMEAQKLPTAKEKQSDTIQTTACSVEILLIVQIMIIKTLPISIHPASPVTTYLGA